MNALSDNVYSTASQLLISYLYEYYNSDAEDARFLASNNLAFAASEFEQRADSIPLIQGQRRRIAICGPVAI